MITDSTITCPKRGQTHLKYHLSTVEVLTPAQIQRYAEFRGYKEGVQHPHRQQH
jgi:hypothetical protein